MMRARVLSVHSFALEVCLIRLGVVLEIIQRDELMVRSRRRYGVEKGYDSLLRQYETLEKPGRTKGGQVDGAFGKLHERTKCSQFGKVGYTANVRTSFRLNG